MSKHHRQRIIVDRELQQRIVTAFVWPAGLAFAVIAVCLVFLHVRINAAAEASGFVVDGFTGLMIATYFLFASAVGFVAFHALRLSHRIAGPAYNFRLTMGRFLEGDSDARVVLRSGDLLRATAEDLNEFLAWTEQSLPPAGSPVACDQKQASETPEQPSDAQA